MHITVTKAGMAGSIRNGGLHGVRHLGVNPAGVMDNVSYRLANALVGNEVGEPALELSFPASQLTFDAPALMAVCGADFSPTVDGRKIANGKPIWVNASSVLSFQKAVSGAWCYVAIRGQWAVKPRLEMIGRTTGRESNYMTTPLATGQQITINDDSVFSKSIYDQPCWALPWCVSNDMVAPKELIWLLPGPEWGLLGSKNQQRLCTDEIEVGRQSNRMGYELHTSFTDFSYRELISSPVNFGTVQLLPSGQGIVLMADHQTTGGYPRIAHVATASLPYLAQKRPGEAIRFKMATPEIAEALWAKQHLGLRQLHRSCSLSLKKFAHGISD